MNCPPCTGTYQNTRNCPARMVTKNGGNTITNGRALPKAIRTTGSWGHIWRAAVWLSIAMILIVLAAGCGLYGASFFI